MNILITNDDGIRAEGIVVLAKAAVKFGSVTVVAPAHQCSAMSHQITLRNSLILEKCDFPVAGVTAYSLEGTPADCMKAALDAVLPEKPDVVLSGINNGYNVGFDIVYSGTAAAAMEGLMNGIPSIALSRHHVGTFDVTEQYITDILEKLLDMPLSQEIWNVNFPTGSCSGILWDRAPAAQGYYEGKVDIKKDGDRMILDYPPMNELDPSNPLGAPNSDLNAVMRGYISVGKVRCTVL